MAEVVQWVDRHHGGDALDHLESSLETHHPAPALLSGILATDAREQSGIWSTTSGVLGAYRSLGALRSTEGPALDPQRFVEGAHTLHICAPGRQQALIAPLVVGMLSEIQAAAYERADVHRPVLFALDELANIAPLPDLPQLVSEGGGQGLLTIGCLQDLSQARTRWGAEADGLLSLFSTTLLLGGIADRTTIRSFSDLAGPTEIARRSHSVSTGQHRRAVASLTTSSSREPLLNIDEVSRGRPGHGLLLDARNQVGWVKLTVAHRDEPWRTLTRAHDRGVLARDR
jgi:type IV secretory pathway TraG/TraD family ATPase VirD4